MTNQTIARARKLRADTPELSARLALDIARQVDDLPDWADDLTMAGERVRFTRDGFDVTVRLEYDSYPDRSYLGVFTDKPQDGAIPVARRDRYAPSAFKIDYEYFLPEITEAEHYESLRKLKYGKAQARATARRYVREAYEAVVNGASFVLSVTVSRAGVELGEAALGGIDFSDSLLDDTDRTYLVEVIEDILPDAIDEAHDKIQALCRGAA